MICLFANIDFKQIRNIQCFSMVHNKTYGYNLKLNYTWNLRSFVLLPLKVSSFCPFTACRKCRKNVWITIITIIFLNGARWNQITTCVELLISWLLHKYGQNHQRVKNNSLIHLKCIILTFLPGWQITMNCWPEKELEHFKNLFCCKIVLLC